MIYLASPYSHAEPSVMQVRFEKICKIAARLMASGLHVFSPIAHTHPIAMVGKLPTGWEYWQEFDDQMIRACDQLWIATLHGWRTSKGVRGEIVIARGLYLPIKLVDSETLEILDPMMFCVNCGCPETYEVQHPGQVQLRKCMECHSDAR